MVRKIALLFFLALCAFGVLAQQEEKVGTLVLHDPELRRALAHSRSFEDVHAQPALTPFASISETSFENVWCKRVSHTFWSNSRHPGYKTTPNQNQDGIGFKCRKGGSHPTFASIDTMTNSQFGATLAVSVGKEIDLIHWKGIRYYYGASLTWLSYEMPAKGRTVYGVVPISHRGISIDLGEFPLTRSLNFRGGFKGVVSWEELRLPKDNIRVRSWGKEGRGGTIGFTFKTDF